ncbi:MAG: hypothetical protein MUQ05_00735 [Schleiferiaceae bacterium]|nr:hypothetical protein [Flavobacteriales bacterium]MDO7565948.1 hypothetical protein [Schleiferiaceae bacterium]MDO7583033.1 hypothetical protein [Schleiferiaceae bacterium]MDO7601625.1 hypothetical protein [Schleiferiaceae bacterium]MDO7621476.1 hypothetical protein [Schleiferiaceae bacterium]
MKHHAICIAITSLISLSSVQAQGLQVLKEACQRVDSSLTIAAEWGSYSLADQKQWGSMQSLRAELQLHPHWAVGFTTISGHSYNSVTEPDLHYMDSWYGSGLYISGHLFPEESPWNLHAWSGLAYGTTTTMTNLLIWPPWDSKSGLEPWIGIRAELNKKNWAIILSNHTGIDQYHQQIRTGWMLGLALKNKH